MNKSLLSQTPIHCTGGRAAEPVESGHQVSLGGPNRLCLLLLELRRPGVMFGPALPSSRRTVPDFQREKIPLSPQIDLQKMPLGKLSKRQIQAAYSILSEVQQVRHQPPPAAPCWGQGHLLGCLSSSGGESSSTFTQG